MVETRCDHDLLPGQCFRCKHEHAKAPLAAISVLIVPRTGASFHTRRNCPSFTSDTEVQRVRYFEARAEGLLPCQYCDADSHVRQEVRRLGLTGSPRPS